MILALKLRSGCLHCSCRHRTCRRLGSKQDLQDLVNWWLFSSLVDRIVWQRFVRCLSSYCHFFLLNELACFSIQFRPSGSQSFINVDGTCLFGGVSVVWFQGFFICVNYGPFPVANEFYNNVSCLAATRVKLANSVWSWNVFCGDFVAIFVENKVVNDIQNQFVSVFVFFLGIPVIFKQFRLEYCLISSSLNLKSLSSLRSEAISSKGIFEISFMNYKVDGPFEGVFVRGDWV